MSGQTTSGNGPAVNQDSVIVTRFEDQVKEYLKLHKQAKAGLPGLKRTTSVHKINEDQRLLADNIRALRPDAKQGEILTAEVAPLFQRLIATAFHGSEGTKVRASLKHAEPAEPAREVPLKVNATYPEGVPLQSTPPSVLLNLPQLPPELDYRIVGRNLVLRDVEANIIVDYLPGVIPG